MSIITLRNPGDPTFYFNLLNIVYFPHQRYSCRQQNGLRGEEPLAGLPAELRPPVEGLLRRVEQ